MAKKGDLDTILELQSGRYKPFNLLGFGFFALLTTALISYAFISIFYLKPESHWMYLIPTSLVTVAVLTMGYIKIAFRSYLEEISDRQKAQLSKDRAKLGSDRVAMKTLWKKSVALSVGYINLAFFGTFAIFHFYILRNSEIETNYCMSSCLSALIAWQMPTILDRKTYIKVD
eukprot:106920_1